jgi:hypothetical protein
MMAKEDCGGKSRPHGPGERLRFRKTFHYVCLSPGCKDGKEVKQSFDFGKAKAGQRSVCEPGDNPAIYVVDTAVTAATKKDLRDPRRY